MAITDIISEQFETNTPNMEIAQGGPEDFMTDDEMDPYQDPEFQQLLDSLPGEQAEVLMQLIKEFKMAVAQGFKGEFEDFVKMKMASAQGGPEEFMSEEEMQIGPEEQQSLIPMGQQVAQGGRIGYQNAGPVGGIMDVVEEEQVERGPTNQEIIMKWLNDRGLPITPENIQRAIMELSREGQGPTMPRGQSQMPQMEMPSPPTGEGYVPEELIGQTGADVVEMSPRGAETILPQEKPYTEDMFSDSVDALLQGMKGAPSSIEYLQNVLEEKKHEFKQDNPNVSDERIDEMIREKQFNIDNSLRDQRIKNIPPPFNLAQGGRIGYEHGGTDWLPWPSYKGHNELEEERYRNMSDKELRAILKKEKDFRGTGKYQDEDNWLDFDLADLVLDERKAKKIGGEYYPFLGLNYRSKDEGLSMLDEVQQYKYGTDQYDREEGAFEKLSMEDAITDMENKWDVAIEEGYEPGKGGEFDNLGIYEKEDIRRRIELGWDQAKGPVTDTGIMAAAQGGRARYGLGSLVSSVFKGAKKGVKSLTKSIKKFAKSDLGKLALTYLATAGVANIGANWGGAKNWGTMLGKQGWLKPTNVLSNIGTSWGNIGKAFKGTPKIKPQAQVNNIIKDALGMPQNLSLSAAQAANLPASSAGTSLLSGIGKSFADKPLPWILGTSGAAGLYTKMNPGKDNLDELMRNYKGEVADWDQRIADIRAGKIKTPFSTSDINYPYPDYSQYAAEGGRIGRAEGGLMDLGGMEKDYRAEGGFVPIGGKEKADDVPARLSRNEFVFTADAVRNAGGGDVDKGSEVMENIMTNLENGGNISEESQGLEGARDMFEVSERLSEVV